jgi:hypothetical protein
MARFDGRILQIKRISEEIAAKKLAGFGIILTGNF